LGKKQLFTFENLVFIDTRHSFRSIILAHVTTTGRTPSIRN